VCSNPSEFPEMLGKALTRKYGNLQEFRKLLNALAKYRAAFARRRGRGFESPRLHPGSHYR
jgi:hypothetical protein